MRTSHALHDSTIPLVSIKTFEIDSVGFARVQWLISYFMLFPKVFLDFCLHLETTARAWPGQPFVWNGCKNIPFRGVFFFEMAKSLDL